MNERNKFFLNILFNHFKKVESPNFGEVQRFMLYKNINHILPPNKKYAAPDCPADLYVDFITYGGKTNQCIFYIKYNIGEVFYPGEEGYTIRLTPLSRKFNITICKTEKILLFIQLKNMTFSNNFFINSQGHSYPIFAHGFNSEYLFKYLDINPKIENKVMYNIKKYIYYKII